MFAVSSRLFMFVFLLTTLNSKYPFYMIIRCINLV